MCAQNASHSSEEPPSSAMLHLIYGFWVSRAIYVTAKLGIPDHLQDQARSALELAEATDTHAPSLNRVHLDDDHFQAWGDTSSV